MLTTCFWCIPFSPISVMRLVMLMTPNGVMSTLQWVLFNEYSSMSTLQWILVMSTRHEYLPTFACFAEGCSWLRTAYACNSIHYTLRKLIQASIFLMDVLTSRIGTKTLHFDVCCETIDQNFDCGCVLKKKLRKFALISESKQKKNLPYRKFEITGLKSIFRATKKYPYCLDYLHLPQDIGFQS